MMMGDDEFFDQAKNPLKLGEVVEMSGVLRVCCRMTRSFNLIIIMSFHELYSFILRLILIIWPTF